MTKPIEFPTRGPQTTWLLTPEKHAELQNLFPHLDLDLEFSTMLAWIEKNGPKSARGMNLFILNWLRRAKSGPKTPLSWNHDALPAEKAPKPTNGESERRRMELWKGFREAGMSELEAKQASYEAWKSEGHGK